MKLSKLRDYQDIILAIVLLIFDALYFKETFMELKFDSLVQYGPDFVPRIYCVGLALASLFLLVQGIRKLQIARKNQTEVEAFVDEEEGAAPVDPPDVKKLLLVIALCTLYIACMKPIGFLISTFLFFVLCMCILAPKEERKLVPFLIYSALASFLLYYVFSKLFYLNLPAGILGL